MRSIRHWRVPGYLLQPLAALVVVVSPGWAQQATITGRVIAAGTNVPLGDSRVTVAGTNNLVAKAPGVVVLPGAMTGAAPVIRIRGLGSLATTGSGVTNNPIYVVDGVRVATATVGLGTGGTVGSLLNDFDPNDIEDVEIVKG